MSYKPAYSMPERARLVLEFLEAGNSIDFEGRNLRLNLDAGMLVTEAKTLHFLGGPPVERRGQIGVHMSFQRFYKMLGSFTYGDLTRMENILRDQKTVYPVRAE